MNRAQAKELKTAVVRLVQAEIAYSWKGSNPLEDLDEIDKELRLARKRLNDRIDNLAVKTTPPQVTL